MNATSAVCLLMGYYYIRSKRVDAHDKCMTAAIIASTIFLIGYLTRHALTGTTYFQGGDLAKKIYLSLLYSHMALAVVTVPMVFRLIYLVKKARIEEHKRLARVAFPIWLYVSVTGIIVYTLLYQYEIVRGLIRG